MNRSAHIISEEKKEKIFSTTIVRINREEKEEGERER
jgi:hypothetical protein